MLVMYVVNSSNVIILFRVIKRQFCYVMMTTASLSGGILKYKKKIHSRLRCQDTTMEETSLYVYYYTYLPFFYRVSNMNMSFSRPKVYLELLNDRTKYVSIIGSIHIRHL